MKVRILKSIKNLTFDKKNLRSGKAIVLKNLSHMEETYGLSVVVDMRAFIIYSKSDMLIPSLKYIRKLERKGFISVDRRWSGVEMEHKYVADRVKALMWTGELREAALEGT